MKQINFSFIAAHFACMCICACVQWCYLHSTALSHSFNAWCAFEIQSKNNGWWQQILTKVWAKLQAIREYQSFGMWTLLRVTLIFQKEVFESWVIKFKRKKSKRSSGTEKNLANSSACRQNLWGGNFVFIFQGGVLINVKKTKANQQCKLCNCKTNKFEKKFKLHIAIEMKIDRFIMKYLDYWITAELLLFGEITLNDGN